MAATLRQIAMRSSPAQCKNKKRPYGNEGAKAMTIERIQSWSSDDRPLTAARMHRPESELAEVLNSVHRLEAALYRFAALVDSESAEVVTDTRSTLNRVGNSLSRVLAFQRSRINQDQIENWENEGGNIQRG
jgi:hypothetical protein